MAPSWSQRLHAFGSSSSNTPTRSTAGTQREKALPHPPPPSSRPPPQPVQAQAFDPPPTLYNQRYNATPTRPHTSGGKQHNHSRSASHPLPKLFGVGKKKSARELGGSYNHADVPFDDDLVPVLDQPTGSEKERVPTRVISGRKDVGGKNGNDDVAKANRRCMCCDSRVMVPKDLDKFRCMGCTTVNDLRPASEQRKEQKRAEAEGFGGQIGGRTVQVNVERVQGVIDKCVVSYLEERCRRTSQPSKPPLTSRAMPQPAQASPTRAGDSAGTAGIPIKQPKKGSQQLTDAPVSSSPPDKPEHEDLLSTKHSATIKDFKDIDFFSYMRDDTPPPYEQVTMQGSDSTPGAASVHRGPPPTATNIPFESTDPLARRPVPAKPTRKPPPPPVHISQQNSSQRLSPTNGGMSRGNSQQGPSSPLRPTQTSPRLPPTQEMWERQRYERTKAIFRPLEDYLLASYGTFEGLNTSFSTVRSSTRQPASTLALPIEHEMSRLKARTRSESCIKTPPRPEPPSDFAFGNDGAQQQHESPFDGFQELDAKTLMLGELGENSSWWTGKVDRMLSADKATKRKQVGASGGAGEKDREKERERKPVNSKSPNVAWDELERFYDMVYYAGENWREYKARVTQEGSAEGLEGDRNVEEIEEDLSEAREHAVRALFKMTENLLKRPGRQLNEPEHMRWLLIVLANPGLYPAHSKPKRAVSAGTKPQPNRTRSAGGHVGGANPKSPKKPTLSPRASPGGRDGGSSGPQHTGILKRVFGLLAHTTDRNHNYLIAWLSRLNQTRFEALVSLAASFVTHRISRRATGRQRSKSAGVNDGGLIPDLTGGAANTSAQLHSAMGLSGSVKNAARKEPEGETEWAGDWQCKAAAKWMSLLFAANNVWNGRRKEPNGRPPGGDYEQTELAGVPGDPPTKARRSGQLMHTSQFYNALLDYHDLIADFKVWESRRDKFSFCQYPLFLSMGAKIKILEYDARRQMEIKAREAYFDSVVRAHRNLDGYFHLKVRRDCMVDDSLRQISQAAGAGQGEDLKKGLRVHFAGEEGVDAGGPRKEWFLMVVREIFDPRMGLFVYDEESGACWFNPQSFETSDQFYLVGALLGLAIYNSTILDVELPAFAFRKLLASAPSTGVGTQGNANVSSITGTKGQMTYTLSDLAEFRPGLARGLQQLLDYDGDVEDTYCWNFVAPVEAYGVTKEVPLMSNGEATPVTNANRAEFVEAYVRYILDTSVARQFEPFKRGFFTVCAGNALSLFRAEEIELLIRGSDESLDVDSLKAVAVYENWRHASPPHMMVQDPAETVKAITWFWDAFKDAPPAQQRKLLTFITGTDRIPAVGAASLVLRIVAGGDGYGGGGREERQRFPVARTCFNMLILWHYDSRAEMEERLWRAVEEGAGFGLK
ncbi:HECT-domain-containing protein [Hortaea werneckii]|nr:HECT-domain-containing protein [Hortaea werneckii]